MSRPAYWGELDAIEDILFLAGGKDGATESGARRQEQKS